MAMFRSRSGTLRAARKPTGWWGSAVEQTADSVMITDRSGVIQYVNAGFTRTTGFSSAEVVGRTPRILKSGKHGPEFYRALWATILEGKPYAALIVNRRKSGEFYSGQLSISPIRNRKGHLTHFVSVLRDVTDLLKNKEREVEMALARTVQERFYGAAVEIPGYQISGTTVQAEEIGGDYFDFIPMGNGSLGIVVADVTGHGAAAALVMAETRAYLRTLCTQMDDPGAVLTHINRALAHDLMDNQFVTLSLARLDPCERTLLYANAGHVPGVLMNPGAEGRTFLRSLGPPLGIFENQRYLSSEVLELRKGDVLLFMSDGVLETRDFDGEEFGIGRAVDLISAYSDRPAPEILDALQSDVREFEAEAEVRDDMTIVVVKVHS